MNQEVLVRMAEATAIAAAKSIFNKITQRVKNYFTWISGRAEPQNVYHGDGVNQELGDFKPITIANNNNKQIMDYMLEIPENSIYKNDLQYFLTAVKPKIKTVIESQQCYTKKFYITVYVEFDKLHHPDPIGVYLTSTRKFS